LNKKRQLPVNEVDITGVLATCNRAPMLRKALASLVQQETGGKFSYDIFVLDDGSTDDTAAVVRERSDAVSEVSITYVYQENVDPYIARNLGVEMARGNWIVF
jgi:glycosyltransferase involved in cell wall biosynthesis